MSVARAIWSQTFAPGERVELERVPCDVKLSLIVLDEKLVDQGRTSIKVYQADPEEDEETTFVLANLIPGKIEAQTIDLIISEDEDISIEVTGKNTVHISGNYIIQPDNGLDDPDFDSEDEDELLSEEDDEAAEKRFEEIVEDKPAKAQKAQSEKPASAKRPAEAAPAAAADGGAHKKHKKNKGGDKPASAPAATAPQAKSEQKPAANGAQQGEHKKNKKNKNKEKK